MNFFKKISTRSFQLVSESGATVDFYTTNTNPITIVLPEGDCKLATTDQLGNMIDSETFGQFTDNIGQQISGLNEAQSNCATYDYVDNQINTLNDGIYALGNTVSNMQSDVTDAVSQMNAATGNIEAIDERVSTVENALSQKANISDLDAYGSQLDNYIQTTDDALYETATFRFKRKTQFINNVANNVFTCPTNEATTDWVINVSIAGAVIVLPSCVNNSARIMVNVDTTSSVTIQSINGETFKGNSSPLVITGRYSQIELSSNGSTWCY